MESTNNPAEKPHKASFWRRSVIYLRKLTNIKEYMDIDAADETIRKNIYFRGPNVLILICAIWIASLGLNVNSVPVIIGAMLVSPLMGPIIGLGLGAGVIDTQLIRASLRNLGIMVGISILASTVYFLVSPLRLNNPTELLARTNPTIYDVLIAFVGGMAGILETSRREKGTVISGVAIATALMPPLCTIGYGFSQWNLHYVVGAFYLFCINSIFIALATFLGVKYLRFPLKSYSDPLRQRNVRRSVAIILLIVIIPSLLSAVRLVRQNNFTRNASSFVTNNRSIGNSYIYDYKVQHNGRHSTLQLFMAGEELKPNEQELIITSALNYGIHEDQLSISTEATVNSAANNELFKEVLQSSESKIATRDEQITHLRQQLNDYLLPTQQLAREIQTQYPSITHVTIARGQRISTSGNDSSFTTILLVESNPPITKAQQEQLQHWLQVRLNTNAVEVLNKNQ